jgi:hypothetical protein
MALTLEATIVIPIAVVLTVGVLHAGIRMYDRSSMDIRTEYRSLLRSSGHHGMFSVDMENGTERIPWSKSIAIDPVRIRETVGWIRDTGRLLEDHIPFLRAFREDDDRE